MSGKLNASSGTAQLDFEKCGSKKSKNDSEKGGAGESTVSVLEADNPWVTLGCGLLFLPVTPKRCAM